MDESSYQEDDRRWTNQLSARGGQWRLHHLCRPGEGVCAGRMCRLGWGYRHVVRSAGMVVGSVALRLTLHRRGRDSAPSRPPGCGVIEICGQFAGPPPNARPGAAASIDMATTGGAVPAQSGGAGSSLSWSRAKPVAGRSTRLARPSMNSANLGFSRMTSKASRARVPASMDRFRCGRSRSRKCGSVSVVRWVIRSLITIWAEHEVSPIRHGRALSEIFALDLYRGFPMGRKQGHVRVGFSRAAAAAGRSRSETGGRGLRAKPGANTEFSAP